MKAILLRNRFQIKAYSELYKEYPILKDERINFWDIQTSQFIWRLPFHGIKNVANGTAAEWLKEKHGWKIWDSKIGGFRRPEERDFKEIFFNPITGKFDWLAEDTGGTLYTPNMPDSILMASPPIRVVNIRCPLTASDPPFFEDFTKW